MVRHFIYNNYPICIPKILKIAENALSINYIQMKITISNVYNVRTNCNKTMNVKTLCAIEERIHSQIKCKTSLFTTFCVKCRPSSVGDSAK